MEENLKQHIQSLALAQLIEESAKGKVERVSTQVVSLNGKEYKVILEKSEVDDTLLSTTIHVEE